MTGAPDLPVRHGASGRAVALTVLTLAAAISAQPFAQAPVVRTTAVQGNVTMLAGVGGNVAVQTGPDGVVLVDSGDGRADDALVLAIRQLSNAPIQYVINTGPQLEHVRGNVTVRRAGVTFTGGNATAVAGVDVGAAVVAHERTLARVSGAGGGAPLIAQVGWPTDTFYVGQMDLFVNGEPIELLHQPAAVSDGNVLVHFRRSDVLVTGDLFRLDSYPVIDAASGGTIAGTIAALNRIIAIAIPQVLQEGGTMIVPGHGRIGDESDVVEYRNMVTIIRDRVADQLADGQSLAQVVAARVTRDYDGRFAAAEGPASADGFVEVIYRELRDGGAGTSTASAGRRRP